MKVLKQVLTLIICVLPFIAGCSILSPVKPRTYTKYVLNSYPAIVKRAYFHGTLYVNAVKADPLYETDKMAYTSHSYRVDYFAKSKWADTPARMLQPLIMKTLQNTHYFDAVTSSTSSIRYDYILNVQLSELRQVFLIHSSYVVLKIHAELINAKTGIIIASKEMISEVPARSMNPFGGVVAANTALSITLKKLTYFCFNAVKQSSNKGLIIK